MMRGTKRASDSSNSILNDSLLQGKRVFSGWQSDNSSKPESSQAQQQQVSTLPLDMQRAELSRQHVRALNTQFASWVQSQLQNHPDELWQDGAQDYLNHATSIMEKFVDVVNWLKANVANGETGTGIISGSEQKNIETDIKESNKFGTALPNLTGITGSLWGFGGQNNMQSNSKRVDKQSSDTSRNALASATTIDENNKSGGVLPSTTGIFGGSWGSVGPKSLESKQISNNLSSDKANSTPASIAGSFGATTPSFGGTTPSFGGTAASFGGSIPSFGGSIPSLSGSGGSKSSESIQIGNNLSSDKGNSTYASTTASFGGTTPSFGSTTPSFGGTSPSFGGTSSSFGGTTPSFGATTPSFGSSWSSGTSFNSSPFSFGIQTSAVSSQSSMPTTNNVANEEEDGEEAAEQPGSPSVKKTEEEGIMVVHEVKCKLYVKSTDPATAWKDKGTGQLSIKCQEGITKGTKESKPTIIIRNDVGKVVLNALLYPGIKTILQKNAVVAIFHSAGDGDDSNSVVARSFLMKTKTMDDRDKLDAAIKEYAPTA